VRQFAMMLRTSAAITSECFGTRGHSHAQALIAHGNDAMPYFKYRYIGLTGRTTHFLLSLAAARNVTSLPTLMASGH
jgi:hypothetical protein